MAQNPINKENKKNKQSFSQIIKIYYLPIVSIIFFLGIILFLIMPKIGTIFGALDKINDLNSDISEKNTLFNQLQSLANNINNLQSQLLALDSLAPSSQTEVVAFNSKIENLANENNVAIITSNFVEVLSDDESALGLNLKEISNTFKILGGKQNVLNFVDEISSLDDFIIIQQMDFSPQKESEIEGNWALDIQIIKFQFTEIGDQSIVQEQYKSIPVDATPSKKVIDYITVR